MRAGGLCQFRQSCWGKTFLHGAGLVRHGRAPGKIFQLTDGPADPRSSHSSVPFVRRAGVTSAPALKTAALRSNLEERPCPRRAEDRAPATDPRYSMRVRSGRKAAPFTNEGRGTRHVGFGLYLAFCLASVIFWYSSGSWLRVQKTSPHSSWGSCARDQVRGADFQGLVSTTGSSTVTW